MSDLTETMVIRLHPAGVQKRLLEGRILAALFALGLFLLPILYAGNLIGIETINMLGRYLCYAIVAIGLDLLWGYTGVLSLCQALFFSFGGYAMGMYLASHGGPGGSVDPSGWKIPACLFVVYPYKVGETVAVLPWFWKPFASMTATVALGLALPAFAAFLIGFAGFRSRVRGVYFAILTQAITVAVWLVFCMNNMKLCGTNGLTRFDACLGFSIASPGFKLAMYIVTLLCAAGVYLLSRKIISSRLGRILIAIRDDENNLRFLGYTTWKYKLFAFVIAAMVSGLAGMLYAPQMGIFTPANMEADKSILVVIWVAVGGRGTLSGALLGALGVNLLYNYFTSEKNLALFTWHPQYWQFMLGFLFIAVVLFIPGGIVDLGAKLGKLKTRWKAKNA